MSTTYIMIVGWVFPIPVVLVLYVAPPKSHDIDMFVGCFKVLVHAYFSSSLSSFPTEDGIV